MKGEWDVYEQSLIGSDNCKYGNISGNVPAFIEPNGINGVICRGRITEIAHQELFHSKFHKLINSIFRGEPYQFAHQTAEYLIRVEELSNRGGQVSDFYLYGNYMGRMYPGDEVEIKAAYSNGRQIVKSIYNKTTNSHIHPGIQLPAWVIRLLVLLFAIVLVVVVMKINIFLKSDVAKEYAAVGVVILGGVVWCWYKIKKIFGRW